MTFFGPFGWPPESDQQLDRSLAQAAVQLSPAAPVPVCVRAEYWVVDTENFGHFEGHELLPNIADVLRIVHGFLETHDAD